MPSSLHKVFPGMLRVSVSNGMVVTGFFLEVQGKEQCSIEGISTHAAIVSFLSNVLLREGFVQAGVICLS